MDGGESVLKVVDLFKTYRIGFLRRKVDAVRGISFEVSRGEIFGLIGPNGAGKTTTIKAILQLIFPSSGSVLLFGKDTYLPEARQRLGYLPENPYIYQYLRPLEFLDLCGRLTGMDTSHRLERSKKLLAELGLSHTLDRPIGRFSKGMMQRLGLTQALLHNPELLILDEPFSGLDPIGRKDVRDALLAHRQKGKTLLFTSHTLSDVELLSDRVAIVKAGKIAACGSLNTLLEPAVRRIEVELSSVNSSLRERLQKWAIELKGNETELTAVIQGDEVLPGLLEAAMREGARVISVTPHRDSLEDLFLRQASADAH
jgi:ABC-2 type transport system ATP-binding protein